MSYRQLDAEKTIATLQTLRNRIKERFAGSGLAGVADDLCELAGDSRSRIEWIEKPHRGLRLAVFVVILLAIGLIILGISGVKGASDADFGLTEAVPLIDSAINDVIMIGAALLFLFSLEVRVKRTRALKALHDLRAISHVIDMHQLTKDPSQILNTKAQPTASSPQRTLTPFQLTRYLDYCSELLSLVGKLAALYAQSLPDQVVVGAVNDIEILTNGLSRKVWQKIVMLDDVARVIQDESESRPAPKATP